ncbi:MAG TPA: hypothetical protein VIF09_11745, partial [Polyangiaceae bacterium]
EIVRKIGKITRYETKSYVGRARILDLDRSAPSSSPRVDTNPPSTSSRPPSTPGRVPGTEERIPKSEEKPISSNKPAVTERGD